MIPLAELEKLLAKDLGDLEPEIHQLARTLTGIINNLDDELLDQDLSGEERRSIHRTVLTALECHLRGLPPPSEEVKFWMKMLDSKVVLPVDSGLQ